MPTKPSRQMRSGPVFLAVWSFAQRLRLLLRAVRSTTTVHEPMSPGAQPVRRRMRPAIVLESESGPVLLRRRHARFWRR